MAVQTNGDEANVDELRRCFNHSRHEIARGEVKFQF